MRLLGVFAHPDDAEIWAGGTFIKHCSQGDEILIITFSKNDLQRIEEAKTGSGIIGATITLLESSLDSIGTAELVGVTNILTSFKPTVVITHWQDDTHPQHRLVCELVNKSIVGLKIATGMPEALYVCDTYNSVGLSGIFHPTCYIDVSDVWEQKLKAIDAHQSQSPQLWKSMITNQALLNGARVGRQYAEGFREVPILGRFRAQTRFF